jgi:hypothetical protein
MRSLVVLCLCVLGLACKAPLTKLPSNPDGPALVMAPVTLEDHSRQLKRLRPLAAAETNTPEARKLALAGHAKWLEEAFTAEGAACGIHFNADAPYRLELVITDLGEVRTKYIVYGIASGVAWGVGTGLLAHSTKLAVGLGGYELLEESAFWIGGTSLFSSFSAPAVVEARLFRIGEDQPLWHETYYALSGRAWTKTLPKDLRTNRAVQLRASLQKVILKILDDLEGIPGFPKGTRKRLAAPLEGKSLQQRILAE